MTPPPMAIGSDTWPGLAKLAEEMGELQQVIAKLMAYPDGTHPDGAGDLAQRLSDELADVKAAALYVTRANADRLHLARHGMRTRAKITLFEQWDAGERRSAA